MDILADMEYIVVLILKMVTLSQATSISQVYRLFGMLSSSIILVTPQYKTRTSLVMADANIWPIGKDFFVLPPGKDTLHGNIDRKRISDLNAIYNPLSYVGIKIRTWYRVMTQHGRLPMPCTTIGIVKYFGKALSTSCDSRLTRPGCRPEYDQLKATSVEIKEWQRTEGTGVS